MRIRKTWNWAGPFVAVACLLLARSPLAADPPFDAAAPPASPEHRAPFVAHVGTRGVTVGELEDRLSPVPRYQLRTFGSTAHDVVRNFFDQILLRDVLLSLGAEDRHIDQQIEVQQGLDRMLSSATLRALLEQLGPASNIPMAEVQAYYDANRDRFDTKDRVGVWRILCATKDEAAAVIAATKQDGSVQSFNKLAREHSMDKATFLRGGNLGFVADNGVSSEPGVKVDPAVVAAAFAVKDGEIAPAPVPEGTGFAVVWRKGTTPGVHRSVTDAKAQIQDVLVKQKRSVAEKALLDRLRAEKVKEVNEDLLGTFDVSIDDGNIKPRKRPGGNIPAPGSP